MWTAVPFSERRRRSSASSTFAADEEWRTAGELVHALWGYGMLSEQERFDFVEAVEPVGAEVEILFILEQGGCLAIAI